MTKVNSDFTNATSAESLITKITTSAVKLMSVDLNNLGSGFYYCYVPNISNLPDGITAKDGELGFILSFMTKPLSSTIEWHGYQFFVDVSRNNIHYRTHKHNQQNYNAWKII